MAVKVRLSEGVEIVVDSELSELLAALQSALAKDELVSIIDPNGDDVVINPRHVLYVSNGTTARLSDDPKPQSIRPEPVH